MIKNLIFLINSIFLLKVRRLYNMTNSIWPNKEETNQTLLKWPTKVKEVNTNATNPKMILKLFLTVQSAWTGPPARAHFARSRGFIECYTDG